MKNVLEIIGGSVLFVVAVFAFDYFLSCIFYFLGV